MFKKRMALLLAVLLIGSLLLSGCGKNTPEASNNSSVAATKNEAATTPTPTQQPPAKLTMFLSSSGTAVPNDFNAGDNDYIKEICKLANVELTEITFPAYADVKTKFNLMIASSSLPDIIHYKDFNEMTKIGKDGAFTDLTDIIKNSKVFSKNYNKTQIDSMKAEDGKIYTLRTLPIEDGWHFGARLDLLNDVGIQELPTTLNGWVDAMKKVKAKYPDSIPYTTLGVEKYTEFIFRPFGMEATNWLYLGNSDKFINSFESPKLKDAVLFAKQLLADGLLDPEFSTNKQADFNSKKTTKNSLLISLNLGSLAGNIETLHKNGFTNAMVVPAPIPVADGVDIDPYIRYDAPQLVGAHCISISTQTKELEGAVRFIETLGSDEVKDLLVFGREGTEYTIKDGKKVFDPAKMNETKWRFVYAPLFSYNPPEKIRNACEISIQLTSFDEAKKKSYNDTFFKYYDDVIGTYNKIGYNPKSVIVLSDDSLIKSNEAVALQRSLLLKAIMGEMTIDEFMKQAADLVKKYQSVTDDYNSKLPQAKALLGMK